MSYLGFNIMRTRTKTAPLGYSYFGNITYTVRDDGNIIQGPTVVDATSKRLVVSEGEDVIIDDDSPGRAVKECTHHKKKIVRFLTSEMSYWGSSDPTIVAQASGSGGVWWLDWFGHAGNDYTLNRNENYPVVPAYERTQEKLVADTVHDFYSNNETDNLLNAIESPQLLSNLRQLQATLGNKQTEKAIIDSLRVKAGKLGSSSSKVARAQENLRKRILGKKFGSRYSGLFLAYSFGIAPLVSDMRKVKDSLHTIRREMSKAKLSEGKLVSIHRYNNGAISYHDNTGAVLGSQYINSGWALWTLYQKFCRRICTVRGYRSRKFNSKKFSELDYLLSRFGATGPTALAWELIPFSFVVDWFVDLRNITDRLDNLLTGSSKRIIDVCVSEKILYTSKASFKHSANYGGTDGEALCDDERSYYHRIPITDYNIVGRSGRFGKKQVALLGALLHQMMANLVK